MVLEGAQPNLVRPREKTGTARALLVLRHREAFLEGFLEEVILQLKDLSQKGVPDQRELRAKESWREGGSGSRG